MSNRNNETEYGRMVKQHQVLAMFEAKTHWNLVAITPKDNQKDKTWTLVSSYPKKSIEEETMLAISELLDGQIQVMSAMNTQLTNPVRAILVANTKGAKGIVTDWNPGVDLSSVVSDKEITAEEMPPGFEHLVASVNNCINQLNVASGNQKESLIIAP